MSYENFHGRVLFHTSFNEYFKENLKLFEAPAFIALLTQHLPKKGVHHIRRYALGGPGLLIPQPRYLDRKALRSGTRAGWTRRPRWKQKHLDPTASQDTQDEYEPEDSICSSDRKIAWARLIAKIYEGCAPR